MANIQIDDPVAYIYSLGRLHDVIIEKINLSRIEDRITLTLDDVNSAFLDTTNYTGRRNLDLILVGAQDFFIDVEFRDDIWISKATVSKCPHPSIFFKLEINLSGGGGKLTSGRASLIIIFTRMEIKD